MRTQYFKGRPINDGASRVCLLYDPKTGRVAHVHGVTVLHGGGAIAEAELEARARRHATGLGKAADGLKALHVPMAVYRQRHSFTVNAAGDALVPAPPMPRGSQRR